MSKPATNSDPAIGQVVPQSNHREIVGTAHHKDADALVEALRSSSSLQIETLFRLCCDAANEIERLQDSYTQASWERDDWRSLAGACLDEVISVKHNQRAGNLPSTH